MDIPKTVKLMIDGREVLGIIEKKTSLNTFYLVTFDYEGKKEGVCLNVNIVDECINKNIPYYV